MKIREIRENFAKFMKITNFAKFMKISRNSWKSRNFAKFMKIREKIAMQSRCAPRTPLQCWSAPRTPRTMLSGVRARVGTGARRRPAGLRRASAIHQLLAPDQRRLIKLPNSIICADLQLIASRFCSYYKSVEIVLRLFRFSEPGNPGAPLRRRIIYTVKYAFLRNFPKFPKIIGSAINCPPLTKSPVL